MIGQPTTISLDGDDWSVYWLPPGGWETLRIWEQDRAVAAERRIPATVPGHAQEALLKAGMLPNPYVGENWREWEWTSEQDWVYEKRFSAPELATGQVARLRFEGIDDAATVFLNGERLGRHEGQFVPYEVEVTERLQPENHLVVIVERAPENTPRRWKARFSYGTDLNPKLVPVGLWDSVSLRITGPVWLDDVTLHANLSIDRTEAAISIVAGFGVRSPQQCIVRTEITQSEFPTTTVEDACTVFTEDTVLVQSTTIPRAQLWWPNGHGRQPLYDAKISLLDYDERLLDQRTITFGLRDVEAIPCEGAAPDTLPYRLRVNGRDIWIKGWNWVPLDLLYAGVSEARYERFLRSAKAANVNLLRVWAGGLIEKEAFYRLCDRFGIMVWQDFPQTAARGLLPSDEPYLEYIEAQAESILARRRSHSSLVLWCGGSDLTDLDGTPLGNDHPALETLRTAVTLEDPQRLWIPTLDRSLTMPSASLHVSTKVAPGPEQSRPAPTQPDRFGEGRLRPHPGTTSVEPARHEPNTEMVQMAQYVIEAHQRQESRCAGTLPWAFNEPYPAAFSPSALDHAGNPKPAYYAVKRAYAPFHVSASFPSFAWEDKTKFTADLWLHNSGAERTLLNVVAVITDLNGRELYQENLAAEVPENAAEAVGDLSWRFSSAFAAPFLLWLEVIDEEGDTIARNCYLHSRAPSGTFESLYSLQETTLEVARIDRGVIIKNVEATVAVAVEVSGDRLLIEDSGFHLCPGSERRVKIDRDGAVKVSAWNAAEVG